MIVTDSLRNSAAAAAAAGSTVATADANADSDATMGAAVATQCNQLRVYN